MIDSNKTYKATISGCNVKMINGKSYVIWFHSLADGHVHAQMSRTIETFIRKDWYVDAIFESEETAIQACVKAIEANDGEVKKVGKIRRGLV